MSSGPRDAFLADQSVSTDPVDELGQLLRDAGATVTLDPRATNRGDCFGCGTAASPETRLVVVARLIRRLPGNRKAGHMLRRPLCQDCRALQPVEQDREALWAKRVERLRKYIHEAGIGFATLADDDCLAEELAIQAAEEQPGAAK